MNLFHIFLNDLFDPFRLDHFIGKEKNYVIMKWKSLSCQFGIQLLVGQMSELMLDVLRTEVKKG